MSQRRDEMSFLKGVKMSQRRAKMSFLEGSKCLSKGPKCLFLRDRNVSAMGRNVFSKRSRTARSGTSGSQCPNHLFMLLCYCVNFIPAARSVIVRLKRTVQKSLRNDNCLSFSNITEGNLILLIFCNRIHRINCTCSLIVNHRHVSLNMHFILSNST